MTVRIERIALKYCILFLCIGLFLVSCSDLKEEIWFKSDGSGTYQIKMQLGYMEQSSMVKEFEEKDKKPMDDSASKMDTTVVMFEMVHDSVRSKMDQPELLKNIKVRICEENRLMFVTTTSDFKNIEQLKATAAQIDLLKEIDSNDLSKMLLLSEESINFSFGGGEFRRSAISTNDQEAFPELKMNTIPIEDKMKLKKIIGGVQFTSTIHFPGEVTLVSSSDCKIQGNDVICILTGAQFIEMDTIPNVEIHYKTNEEKLDMEKYKFDIVKKEAQEKHYLGIRDQVKFTDIGSFYQKNLPVIFGAVMKAGAEMDGMPSGVYFIWDDERGEAEMMAALPLKKPIEIEGFETVTIPAGNTLTMDYYGTYEKMTEPHGAFDAFIEENKYMQIAPVIEEYVSDPTLVGVDQCLTKITYYLKN